MNKLKNFQAVHEIVFEPNFFLDFGYAHKL